MQGCQKILSSRRIRDSSRHVFSGGAGRGTRITIDIVQSMLVAAVKHDSIDTASELLSETLVETCKEARWSKAIGSKIKCKP